MSIPTHAVPRLGNAQFELTSHWHIGAPIERVWAALESTDQWPRWWRYVRSVQERHPGDADGLGAVRRIAWSSRLPYGVSFDVEVIAVQHLRLLRGRARGQLDGTGTWKLTPDGDTTHVQYLWCVDLGSRWMRMMAPIAAPVFRWNHNGVMRAGAQGLARHLEVRLIDAC